MSSTVNIVGSLYKIKKILSIVCDTVNNLPNPNFVRYVLYDVNTYYSSTGIPFTNKVILFNALDMVVLNAQELIKFNMNPNNVNKLVYITRVMLASQDPTIPIPVEYTNTLNLVLDISTKPDIFQTWALFAGPGNFEAF